jgi:Protein of unknown function (DUF3303)
MEEDLKVFWNTKHTKISRSTQSKQPANSILCVLRACLVSFVLPLIATLFLVYVPNLISLISNLFSFTFFNHYHNKEVIMKFMLTWRIHPDKRQAAFSAFAQMTSEDDAKDRGDKIKLIGRWHDLSQFTGVAICETDDAQALASWALNWNNVLDVETYAVLDDEEARAVGKAKLDELAKMKAAPAAN